MKVLAYSMTCSIIDAVSELLGCTIKNKALSF